MARQQLRWKGSGEIEFYPDNGRPTSATVIGYREGYSTLWSSEAVTLDPYTDTITGAAMGDTVLTVSDTTEAIVGRRYWVKTSTGGFGHEVECVDVPASNKIEIAAPLRIDITSGTIEGHRLARTVTETTQILRSSRALWTMTYPTGTVEKTTWFQVVGLPMKLDDFSITEHDLETVDTEFGEAADRTGQWRKLVIAAFNDVWRELERSYKPDLLRLRDMLDGPIIYRTLFHRFRHQEERRNFYQGEYDKAMGNVLGSTEAWYDSDDDLLRSAFGMTTKEIGDVTINVCSGSPLNDGCGAGDGIEGEGLPAGNRLLVG
jgi:hypothetical protein